MNFEKIPASYAQSRLWVLDNLIPDKAVYNVSIAYELTGNLNREALAFAMNELIKRHEILRTCYVYEGDTLWQIIAAELAFEVDYSQSDNVKSFLDDESQKPFDLGSLPLMRVSVLSLEEPRHILSITMHHIITDGWSFTIFCKELAFYYNAFCTGDFSGLPKLFIQYADFALWQRDWLKGSLKDKQLDFWKKTLEGAPQEFELPADRLRPKQSTYKGAVFSFKLPIGLSVSLKGLARKNNVTDFILLFSIFQILLFRLSSQKDFVVGVPVANRHYSGIENLIGFFVNTVAICSRLDGELSFIDVLRGANESMIQSLDNQDIPFEKVVEHLKIVRQQNRHPIFQVMFVLQNAGDIHLELKDLKVQHIPLPSHGAKFDLLVSAQENQGTFFVDIEYAVDLFDQVTIEQYASCFQTLAEQILQNPKLKIQDLFLLSPSFFHSSAFKGKKMERVPFENIVQAFNSIVAKFPDHCALSCDNKTVTYKELNSRSNSLQRRIPANSCIAVYLDQTEDLGICFISVLKASSCYLPIDPSMPLERAKRILEEANPALILTTVNFAPRFHGLGYSVLEIDSMEESVEDFTSSTFENNGIISSDAPAYLVYTSGSTGTPKGVVVSHRNFLHSTSARQYHYEPVRSILLMHSIAFDVAIASMGWALLSGAEFVLPGNQGHKDLNHLLNLISKRKVSHFLCQPTLYQLLLSCGKSEALSSLKGIALGGERWNDQLVNLHISKVSFASLYNEYGPTEATVWSSYKKIYDCSTGKIHSITIGKPIANTSIYILDQYSHHLPIKMSGEICIAGEGVCTEYLNDPILTKQKFLSNVPGFDKEKKFYRTGDKGRYLETGEIELLGRLDKQVKIRGYRVEIKEVEIAFSSLENIEQFVVTDVVTDDVKLAVYIVPNVSLIADINNSSSHTKCQALQGEHIEKYLEKIRDEIEKVLSDYMVPTYFIAINKVPLTLNDKVDKEALPKPFFYERSFSQKNDECKNHVEETLYAIWKEVLQKNHFSITDNFFRISGNSLLAIQIVWMINDRMDVKVSIHTLFENPTIQALGKIIQRVAKQKKDKEKISESDPFVIKKKETDEKIPLSYSQERFWRREILSDKARYNMPMALRLLGALDLITLVNALSYLLERHSLLRSIIKVENDIPVQYILPEINKDEWLYFKDITHLDDMSKELAIASIIEDGISKKFDFERGPLIRISIIRERENSHVIYITKHHVFSDGLSMELFLRELSCLYNGSDKLEPLSLQYSDFCFWQRDFLQGKAAKTQISYWQEQLRDLPPLVNLPLDRERPIHPTTRGDNYYENYPIDSEWQSFCANEGVSPFMVLISVFNLLLFKRAGQRDFIVGTVIAKRDQKELQNIIGPFINLIPLRFQIEESMPFIDLLVQVKKVFLEGYRHSDIPFDLLLKELGAPLQSRLFNVVFNLLESFGNSMEFHKLEFEFIPFDYHISRYDLTLEVSQCREELKLRFEYAADLFDETTIKSMGLQYKMLLKECVKFPSKKISELA